jgi:hypothetical protein
MRLKSLPAIPATRPRASASGYTKPERVEARGPDRRRATGEADPVRDRMAGGHHQHGHIPPRGPEAPAHGQAVEPPGAPGRARRPPGRPPRSAPGRTPRRGPTPRPTRPRRAGGRAPGGWTDRPRPPGPCGATAPVEGTRRGAGPEWGRPYDNRSVCRPVTVAGSKPGAHRFLHRSICGSHVCGVAWGHAQTPSSYPHRPGLRAGKPQLLRPGDLPHLPRAGPALAPARGPGHARPRRPPAPLPLRLLPGHWRGGRPARRARGAARGVTLAGAGRALGVSGVEHDEPAADLTPDRRPARRPRP